MSFWDIAKKVGEVAVGIGVAKGKEIIRTGKEIQTNKTLSDEELQKKADDTGFFSKTKSIDRKLAKSELERRKNSMS